MVVVCVRKCVAEYKVGGGAHSETSSHVELVTEELRLSDSALGASPAPAGVLASTSHDSLSAAGDATSFFFTNMAASSNS